MTTGILKSATRGESTENAGPALSWTVGADAAYPWLSAPEPAVLWELLCQLKLAGRD